MRADRDGGSLAAGQMLDDKYRIDELLEVGGMGAVYVGSHTKLQKRVAIKVLRSELASAVEIVERFLREAVAASRIGHENIIEVTDIGKAQNGAPFIVMELLEGENLAARIKRVGPLPVPQACHIAVEILSAMEAAHRAGIVHRDLKPENVFLARKSRSESVKVLDFGISRMMQTEEGQNRLTLTGLVMGTPYYMSPEQACGESEITHSADIYAVGVILYEMLTAKVPFEGTNYNSLIYKVLSGTFPPARTYVALPEPLERIIYRAMALRPEHRFASATELTQALEPFVPLSSPSQPFQLLGWSPTPAGGFQPQAPAVASLAALSASPARIDPIQDAYASTMADTHPDQLGGDEHAKVTAKAKAQVMPAEPAAPARRGSRGAIVAVAAVLLLGAIGAGLALWQSSREGREEGETVAATEPAASTAPASPAASTAPASPAASSSPAETTPPATAGVPVAEPAATSPDTEPVTLSFVVTPADATIRADGKAIEGRELTMPRGGPEVTIEVSREGYLPKQRKVAFESNREVEIILEREPARSGPRRKPQRQPEKPGDKRIITDSPYE
jgi:eukaryotic-like serine/threonine-protein kinase